MTELKIAQIEKLQEIASQSVPEQDYQQQIDRWNEYQTILDDIEKQIVDKGLKSVGVFLTKNIESSLNKEQLAHEAYDRNISSVRRSLYDKEERRRDSIRYKIFRINRSEKQIDDFVREQMKNMIANNTLQSEPVKSDYVTLTCSPEIHIDEFQYMNRYVKNVPEINKDPIIYLPKVEARVSKAWIAQNSILDVMKELNNTGISEDLKRMTDRRNSPSAQLRDWLRGYR